MRTFEPVASSAFSNRTSSLLESFATRASRSSDIDARARQHLHALLGVPLVGPEQDLLPRLLAAQVPLRQRRPVVGRVGLAPDEQDVAVRSLLAQVTRAVAGRDAAADQQELDRALSHGRGTG